MQLEKREEETIIMSDENSFVVWISTYNQALKGLMRRFQQRHKDFCSLEYETAEGRETYSLAKNQVPVLIAQWIEEQSSASGLSDGGAAAAG